MTDSSNDTHQISSAEKRRMLADFLRKEAQIPRSYPLSFAQQRLWFLDQWEPNSTFYNIPIALKLHGQLSLDALISSIHKILQRHEILRTTFTAVDGHPSQVISQSLYLRFPLIDLSTCSSKEQEVEIKRLALEDATLPFDLQNGPLLRMKLLQPSKQEHILLLNVHHIIFDGWSTGIFLSELNALYHAFSQGLSSPLPELPVQYADYALWQREWLQGKTLEDQLIYWKHQLQDLIPLELPLDYPRPTMQTFQGNSQTFTFPRKLMVGLKELGRREGVTLFMTLLATFQILLARYSGQEDIVVGSPIAGRTRPETEGLIGFFVNTLVLRGNLSGDPSFRELLGRVREMCLGAYAHQDLPFEKLVEELQPERDMSRNPLFQVMFTLQNTPVSEEKDRCITLHTVDFEQGTAKFDLVIILEETEQGLLGEINYNIDLFDAGTVERMAHHYHYLLENIVADSEQRIYAIPILTIAEQKKFLIELNTTEKTYPQDVCLHQLIEAQVEKTPDAVSIVCEDQHVTYEQINRRANQLSRQLIASGIGAEVLVALFGERSIDYLIAMLAVFKAGGVYLPLDPLHPVKRLSQVIIQSGCGLILTTNDAQYIIEQALENIATGERPSILPFDAHSTDETFIGNVPPRCTPHNLAYVIYTSGSTGAAKGVMVEHIGMLNHIYAKISDVQLSSADCVAQNGPQCFDISVWQSFAALLVGGKVHIFKDEIAFDPHTLIANIAPNAISILQLVPSMLREIISSLETHEVRLPELTTLRWLVPTGDALPVELCKRWLHIYSTIPLLNTYGSTECSDDQCHFVIDQLALSKKALAIAPIGFPIPNMRVYVLDRAFLPVPVGVVGELYIGGVGVGRGYLNESARTATSFIPNPFAQQAGERLYKTGDLVCYLPDGNLKFLGRSDYLTKIHGYRIEIGEIEALLEQHQSLREAVVLVKAQSSGEKYLVAYVVPESDSSELQKSTETPITDAAEYVVQWQDVYETVYHSHQTSSHDPTINLRMWIDSYTRQSLLEVEILECITTTVQRILHLKPRRVLEIGCGTGQLLSRIAPYCTSYSGVDFSREAIAFLKNLLYSKAGNWQNVHLSYGTAHDLGQNVAGPFDTIILNEVIQYFPSVEYLLQTLKDAVQRLSTGGTIFIGGVRSLPLLEMFHLSLLLHQASDSLSLKECHQLLQKKMEQEKELALDPAFFCTLKQFIPEISSVQLQLKGGHHHNEFTMFRYDVILSTRAVDIAREAKSTFSRLSWEKDALDIVTLQTFLVQNISEVLVVTDVPNARLMKEAKAQELFKNSPTDAKLIDLKHAVQENVNPFNPRYLEPEELWKLGFNHAYEVDIYWTAHRADGYYDVVFRKRKEDDQGFDMSALIERELHDKQHWEAYANVPLKNNSSNTQSESERKLVASLRSYLQERLPEYMVPTMIVVMNTIPLNANGKVDRNQLPVSEIIRAKTTETFVGPSDQIEYQLVQLFEEVLGVHPIGVHDNFFSLSGHSLSSVRLIARIRKAFNQNLPLSALFHGPTVAQLAKLLHQNSSSKLSSSLVALQPIGEGSPFFCIHPAGGGVTSYVHLSHYLGQKQPFYGVQAPALYDEQKPYQRIEDMAAGYVSAIRTVQPCGPYALGGWSAGGLVAFEMALQLCEQGQEVALLAIMDVWAPVKGNYAPPKDDAQWIAEVVQHFVAQTTHQTTKQFFPPLLSETDLRKLSPAKQEEYMVDMGKRLQIWPEDLSAAQIHRYLDVFRANVIAEYNYLPQKSYPNLITLFKSSEITPERMREIRDWGLNCDLNDQTMGWGTFTPHPVEVHVLPGDHFMMIEEPSVQILAEQLGHCLDRLKR